VDERDEPVLAAPLDAFFDQPDDALLLGAIGESVAAMVEQRGEAALPSAARAIALTNRAEYHVGNGGFRYFFEPQEHRTADTVAALRGIGAGDAADALARAVAFFPHGEPHADWDARMDWLASMPAVVREQFEADAAFLYGLSPFQARFARAQRAGFAGMPAPVRHLLPQPAPAVDASTLAVVRWLVSQGAGPETGPLRPHSKRWCHRNGSVPASLDEPLSGVEIGPSVGSAVALLAHLAQCRAARSIERLTLDHTPGADGGLAEYALALPALTDLAVAGGPLRAFALERFPRLASLSVGRGVREGEQLAWLSTLVAVRELEVQRDGVLRRAAFERIAALPRLERLELRVPEARADDVEALGASTTLQRVCIAGLTISVALARALLRVPRLRTLELPGCSIEPAARALLLEASVIDGR
jgi:hypothetical protein